MRTLKGFWSSLAVLKKCFYNVTNAVALKQSSCGLKVGSIPKVSVSLPYSTSISHLTKREIHF